MNVFMNTKEKIVSIIVPIYNVENYLAECINSVLAQTYTNFELLLVNDGSTDNSGLICEGFSIKDNRIRVFNKDNGGLSSARNYGIERAIGEYVIFLDSDDYWMNDRVLENLLSIAHYTKADIVRGEYIEVDENGRILYMPELNEELKQISNTVSNNYMFVDKVLSRGHFSWLFLIRTSSIRNLRFNEEHMFQEDIEFNIRYFSEPRKCVYTPFMFYAYRKRANSIMSTVKIENLKYSFELSNIWYQYSEMILEKKLSVLYKHNAIMMYYLTLNTLSQEPYYNNRICIIKKLSLINLSKKVRKWSYRSKKIYPLPIYLSPFWGICCIRIKHKIGRLVWKLRGYFSTKI